MPKGVYVRKQRSVDDAMVSLRRRLKKMCEPIPVTGCFLFTGYVSQLGYGIIAFRKTKRIPAHRASYMVHVGPIPDGMDVCHKCDVRSCVNPDHLWIGSHHDNMMDMASKGRASSRPGEQHPNAILTDDQVRYIRSSGMPRRKLAEMIGVSRRTISDVLKKKSWRHVD